MSHFRAVAKDQLHPALKVEKCLGKKHRNAFTVALHLCLRTFGNAHDDGMSYYVKCREILSTVDLTQTARDMNARQAKHRAVCIDNADFITLMYKHGNDFVTDGAALTRVRSHVKTRNKKEARLSAKVLFNNGKSMLQQSQASSLAASFWEVPWHGCPRA